MTEGSLPRRGILYHEHVYLGATFATSANGDLLVPASYAGETSVDHPGEGALLADLTGFTFLLLSSRNADALCDAAFCAERIEPGCAAYEPALTGEGTVSSIPLVARTGASEYVVLDASRRGPVLHGWLSFLAGIRKDGYAPYEGVELEDAAKMLVALLVAGPDARQILSDYVMDASELPSPRQVRRCTLDHIPAFVIGLPDAAGARPGYVLLVAPPSAVVLWRSLLSFSEVKPVGHDAVSSMLESDLPWGGLLAKRGIAETSRDELTGWHLLREGNDFVGQRALS